MNFSELTIRLVLLFFPGIICYLVFEQLTVKRERKTQDLVILSLMFGMFSYLTYYAISFVCGIRWIVPDGGFCNLCQPPNFFAALTDSKVPINHGEIFTVAVISFFLGVFLSYADNMKWVNTVARRCGITSFFAEKDVWQFAMNQENAEWCVVRDISRKLMFQGYVRAFSDVEMNAELLLTDVIVYNEETGQECYRADCLYLSRNKDDMTIQFQSAEEIKGDVNGPSSPQSEGHSSRTDQAPLAGGNGEKGAQPTQHEHGSPAETGR